MKGLLCVQPCFEADPLGKLHFKHYEVKQECTPEQENEGLLQVIYENGKFYNQTTLEKVRSNLNKI